METTILIPKFQLHFVTLSSEGNVSTNIKFLYHQHNHLQEVCISHVNLSRKFFYWLLYNSIQLEILYLVNYSLSKCFILPFQSHMHLRTLDIFIIFFNGEIPMEIGAKLPRLIPLTMSRNDFNSSIPSSFNDMKLLKILDLSTITCLVEYLNTKSWIVSW